jgi:hypothetical protein
MLVRLLVTESSVAAARPLVVLAAEEGLLNLEVVEGPGLDALIVPAPDLDAVLEPVLEVAVPPEPVLEAGALELDNLQIKSSHFEHTNSQLHFT